MRITMPENNLDKLNVTELWTFIVVIISGAIGGCSAAFTTKGKDRNFITMLTLLGYCITGIFGALVMFTMTYVYYQDFSEVILSSLLAGFSTALALISTNVTFKLVLKKLGIELQVSVKRVKPKKKSEK